MNRRFWFVALAGAFLMTLCLSPVQAQRGNKGVKQNYLVRVQFRDASSDGVRSDELITFFCGDDDPLKPYDYIDAKDTCPGRPDAGDPHATASYVGISHDSYGLATRASTDPCPSRFLVLDFGANNMGSCPTLVLASNPSCPATPPTPTCLHSNTGWFSAENAFAAGATTSAVSISIEHFPDGASYWIRRYQLQYINPLTRTVDPLNPNIVTIGALGDDFTADLYEVLTSGRKKRIGTSFWMPFQVTLTKTNQIFQ